MSKSYRVVSLAMRPEDFEVLQALAVLEHSRPGNIAGRIVKARIDEVGRSVIDAAATVAWVRKGKASRRKKPCSVGSVEASASG
jgi:hypothetical protein